jgi:hypothetical protein
MFGRGIVQKVVMDYELIRGGHAHTVSKGGDEMCHGGDPECPLWGVQLAEALEAWSGS